MHATKLDDQIDDAVKKKCLACQKGLFCPKHSEQKISRLMPEDYRGNRLAAVQKFYHTGKHENDEDNDIHDHDHDDHHH